MTAPKRQLRQLGKRPSAKAKPTAPGRVVLARMTLKQAPAWIEFRDLFKVRLVLGEDGRRRVIINDLADALGIQRNGLQARAKRHLVEGMHVMCIPSEGGAQDMATLDLRLVPALLLGVDVARVKAPLRARLQEIKDELTDALAAYTFDGAAVNPHFAPAPLPPLPAPAAVVQELAQLKRGVRFLAGLRERVFQINDGVQSEYTAARERGETTPEAHVNFRHHLCESLGLLEDCQVFLEHEMQGLDGMQALNRLSEAQARDIAKSRLFYHWMASTGPPAPVAPAAGCAPEGPHPGPAAT